MRFFSDEQILAQVRKQLANMPPPDLQAVNPSQEAVERERKRRALVKVLAEIQDGTYARNWILENQAGRPSFNLVRRREQNLLIEQVGRKLRAMMPWLDAK